MKKYILAAVLSIVFLAAVTHGTMAAKYPPSITSVYTTAQEYSAVQTNVGTVKLPAGVRLGGNPTNYVTLTSQYQFWVEEDEEEIIFVPGTVINCDDYPPGEPSPCDNS